VGGEMTVGDIEDLPPGAKVFTAADVLVVHCVLRAVEEEEAVAAEGAVAEPEVIGKGKEEEEGEVEEKE
jgi:hypothetical protein